ncbi:MAG: hypothetical protein ABIP71_11380, partial [Verrucomicrobiota bacterium]
RLVSDTPASSRFMAVETRAFLRDGGCRHINSLLDLWPAGYFPAYFISFFALPGNAGGTDTWFDSWGYSPCLRHCIFLLPFDRRPEIIEEIT